MITRITGTLVSVNPDACGIAAGPFEYEVYVPAFVFRNLQGMVGKEVTLKTIDYLEGTPGKGNLTPRLIGFLSDAERDFFCSSRTGMSHPTFIELFTCRRACLYFYSLLSLKR